MGSERAKFQAYVPTWIDEAVEGYRKDRNLSRSQAIEQILTEYFQAARPEIQSVDSSQREEIDRLTKLTQQLERSLSQLTGRVDALEERNEKQEIINDNFSSDLREIRKAQAPTETPFPMLSPVESQALIDIFVAQSCSADESKSDSQDELPIIAYLATHAQTPEAEAEPAPLEPETEPEQNIRRLSPTGLAKRLGISAATLTRHRKSPDFERWVTNKDMQGIPWKYDSVAKVYLGKSPDSSGTP